MVTLLLLLFFQWYPVQRVNPEEQPAYLNLNVITAPFALTFASRRWAASSLRVFATIAVVPTFGSTTWTLHCHIGTMKTFKKSPISISHSCRVVPQIQTCNVLSVQWSVQLSTRLVQFLDIYLFAFPIQTICLLFVLSNAIFVHSITGAKKALSGFACSSLSQFDYRFSASLSDQFIWRLAPTIGAMFFTCVLSFVVQSNQGLQTKKNRIKPKLKESDSALYTGVVDMHLIRTSTHLH